MSREVKNLAHSTYDRLRYRARVINRPFEWVLQSYANERFLYRLSKSDHCDNFILKGGLVFVGWNVPLRRHTMDIDFRVYTGNDIENIASIIKDICLQHVEDDGMVYDISTIVAEAILEQAEYPGIRVRFLAKLGNMTKVPMQVDLSFSDEITPHPIKVNYPALLDMPSPELKSYPKETVIAEKLHCLVYRGELNSRKKDFYDIWLISQQFDFDGSLLQSAITETFLNRETDIPAELPAGITNQYAKDNQAQWEGFLHSFNPGDLEIRDFQMIVGAIQEFLWPVLLATINDEEFKLTWSCVQSKWM